MTATPAENPAPFPDPTLDRSGEPDDADLPDMSAVMIDDMREGYLRFGAIAEEARQSAARDRRTAIQHDDEVTQYRAKQKALGDLLIRLGYDPLDPSVAPGVESVAAPTDYVDTDHGGPES